MAVQSDESGFLLGINRLKELNKGVDKVHTDTSEILAILHNLISTEAIQRDRNYKQVTSINTAVSAMAKRQAVSVTINTGNSKVTRKTGSNIVVDSSVSASQAARGEKPVKQVRVQSRDNTGRFTASSTNVKREGSGSRDASGRFVGSAKGITEKSLLGSVSKGIDLSKVGMNADVSHIDPTVDAVRELSTLMAPGKAAFKLMGRGSAWLFKRRKTKKAEDIPNVQLQHNQEVERHNYEERKLFKKLIDAVNRGNNKSLASLLGPALLSRLLGGGGGGRNGRDGRNAPNNKDKTKQTAPVPIGGGKDKPGNQTPGKKPGKTPGKTPGKIGGLLGGLGKRVPILGSLLGAGMVASSWSDMDAQGKGGGIGSLVGGGIGGVLGAFGGPVGAVAGATIGSYLGDSVGQKIGKWTGTLEKQDVGGSIISSWNTTTDVIKNYFKLSMLNMGRMGGMMGMGGGGFVRASYGNGSSGGGSGLSGGTPSDYNPENEIPITRVLESGKGYNVVELADGSVIRQDGNWNWRNRNAGNISDGDFAKSRGRVDQSGAKGSQKRFAVFPTFAAGRKAKKELLFEGQNYRNLDLMGAIARYAPKHENNTAAYQKRVLGAVGSNKRMGDYTAAERETILNAIQAQEGSLKKGKVTVLQGPTKSVQPTSPGKANAPKAIQVKSVPSANQTKPLYASNSPAVKPVSIPTAPTVLKRESRQPGQQPVLMASNQDNISQNPADRDIAHAITGGLGMNMGVLMA